VDKAVLRAVVGADTLSGSTNVQMNHDISNIIIHETYNPMLMTNDIALVRVNTPININGSNGYINGICLPTEGQKCTQYVTLSGYKYLLLKYQFLKPIYLIVKMGRDRRRWISF